MPLNRRKPWELVIPGTSEGLKDGNEDPEDWMESQDKEPINLLGHLPKST